MMEDSFFVKYNLNFKKPSGTSRGILTDKTSYFLVNRCGTQIAVGECSLLSGLSPDCLDDYEQRLQWALENVDADPEKCWQQLEKYPSIQFGLEQLQYSKQSNTSFELFPSDFTKHKANIPINGLIWMGSITEMYEQLNDKIADGFTCVKLKIGALDFEKEYALLRDIRQRYTKEQIEIRVDANGGFSPQNALERLERLAMLDIHSIEQPIAKGLIDEMAILCRASPLPIALDEELIGVYTAAEKRNLLEAIKPHYIILKPSLIGGYRGSQQWIDIAKQLSIDWWVTSALESNIGLSAIAQWVYTLSNPMVQGLGTGGLYINNIPSPLYLNGQKLFYNHNCHWQLPF